MRDGGSPEARRRTFLKAALGFGLGWTASQEGDPRRARPQENDRLVFSLGSRAGQVVTPADVALDQPPVMAYPMDVGTGLPRDGSRLNLVLLLHLDPEKLAEETRRRSAAGIVAYSAICTHTGCDVADWLEQSGTLFCACHDSAFDPNDGARVVEGPAPRRLPALPLKIVEGVLIVAGGFSGRVGPQEG